MEITLKTLTPLWTGGVDGKVDRLHETAILGSLRWWYEALVRGLGGYACDPTSDDRCQYDAKKPFGKQLCPACYLFGATGWGRKFRLQVISTPKIASITGNIKVVQKGQDIAIQIIPLRPISEEEWCLLQLTLRLISEYGAMGGKTVFKPTDESRRQNQFHHQDFGLVDVHFSHDWPPCKGLDILKAYVTLAKWRRGEHHYHDEKKVWHDYSWASLRHFWCVKGRYLARQNEQKSTFNKVITRKEPKRQAKQPPQNKWLAGTQQRSKKTFSFKEPARTFGFVHPRQQGFDSIKKRLQGVWPDFDPDEEFLTGIQILRKLTAAQGRAL
jgi:CRISPR-associated protein Cmr1